MTILRTIYLYDLNNRSRKHDEDPPKSSLFLEQHRPRNNVNLPSFIDLEKILPLIPDFIDNNVKNGFHNIRVIKMLNKMKKKTNCYRNT